MVRYTTGWTREDIKTETAYAAWLKTLKNGDEVLYQQFHPAGSEGGILDLPFERWEFERVRVWDAVLCSVGGNDHPFNPEDGKGRYWGSETEWGNVFPARIVPLHSDLPAKELGDSVYGHHPVYEPLFFGSYRHHALLPYGANFGIRQCTHKIERHYWREVNGGKMIVFFSEVEPGNLQLPEGFQYLFSEYLRR